MKISHSKCEKSLMGWLAGVALSMSFIGIMSIIDLFALQVPRHFVNGLVAFILTLIPYRGAILSVIPPLLLALLDSPWKAGAVLLLYFLIAFGFFFCMIFSATNSNCYSNLG